MAKKQHDHRIFRDDGEVECECGQTFASDDLWRAHQEKLGTPLDEISQLSREPSEPEPFPESG